MRHGRARIHTLWTLCLVAVAGCATKQGGVPAPPPPPTHSTAVTTTPSQPAGAGGDSRGRVIFRLATEDGYQGTVTVTAYEPVSLHAYPGASALAECSPYPDPRRTALVRVDFSFRDQSPPGFPWKLGWSASGFGPSRVLATRSGPAEPFSCAALSAWSGPGTMSALLALDDYYSPKRPMGTPAQLPASGAEFPLAGGVTSDDITIVSRTGDIRGAVLAPFSPVLRIALTAEQ